MGTRRVVLVMAGLALAAVAVVVGSSLAGEARSPGSIGIPLLLALPGLGLIATGLESFQWTRLLAVGSLATLLVGLDVTDSARQVVVNSGYAVAVLSAAACVVLIMLPRHGMLRLGR